MLSARMNPTSIPTALGQRQPRAEADVSLQMKQNEPDRAFSQRHPSLGFRVRVQLSFATSLIGSAIRQYQSLTSAPSLLASRVSVFSSIKKDSQNYSSKFLRLNVMTYVNYIAKFWRVQMLKEHLSLTGSTGLKGEKKIPAEAFFFKKLSLVLRAYPRNETFEKYLDLSFICIKCHVVLQTMSQLRTRRSSVGRAEEKRRPWG